MRNIVVVLGFVTLLVVAEPPTQSLQSDGNSFSHYGAPSGGAPAPQYGTHREGAHRPQPSSQYGVPNGGYDGDSGGQANYEFKYDVEDQQFGVKFGHQESRQGETAQGEYYVMLPDGRIQHVVYIADQGGYHPKVTYEGTGGGQGYGRGPSQGGYT